MHIKRKKRERTEKEKEIEKAKNVQANKQEKIIRNKRRQWWGDEIEISDGRTGHI